MYLFGIIICIHFCGIRTRDFFTRDTFRPKWKRLCLNPATFTLKSFCCINGQGIFECYVFDIGLVKIDVKQVNVC